MDGCSVRASVYQRVLDQLLVNSRVHALARPCTLPPLAGTEEAPTPSAINIEAAGFSKRVSLPPFIDLPYLWP
jgi:hypothetical protein